jgi:tRNA/rRNA methyltransferase
LTSDPLPSPLDRLSRVRVVLHSPRHPGNIGAAARAMKTMGLSRLALVTPERFPDDEAYRRASGARDLIDAIVQHPDLDAAAAGCVAVVAVAARPRDHAPVSMPPRTLMPRLLELAAHGEVALVFGNETNGLARADVNRCDFLTRIPTDAAYASLNLGAAVQVLCYELRSAALAAAGTDGALPGDELDSPLARHEQVVQLLAHAERTLVALDFLVPDRPSRLMERIARLARKARLEQEEVNILRGVLAAAEALCGRPAGGT